MRINEIWEKAEKGVIYFILVVFIATELLSVFMKGLADFMDAHGSLLLISLILLSIFRYLDKNISFAQKTGLKAVERFTTDVLSLFNTPNLHEVKIFANSSYKYFNAISESNIRIDSVYLLIRDFRDAKSIQFPTSETGKMDFANNSKQLVKGWKSLLEQGKINKLHIYAYPFDSILHFMIIDNCKLHFGLLKPKHEFPGSDLNGSFIVDNTSEDGKSLIKSYEMEFNSIMENFSEELS
ncbi:hypothetical protein [Mucilaginibacter sp. dw_454]|uniref:hypothetical protein n=1 Tax=Mucilaginibacter sp. dw_454 TaxID=2720079 RepID=UPI001BD43EBC|nr:hypothetical protein [Mucilaginibacter sp. dw_454]